MVMRETANGGIVVASVMGTRLGPVLGPVAAQPVHGKQAQEGKGSQEQPKP